MKSQMTWDDLMEAWEGRLGKHITNPTHVTDKSNPGCGDKVYLYLVIEDGKIVDASSEGQGCVLSQGVAAYMCEKIIGLSVEEARNYDIEFDFEITPLRKQCAALPLFALERLLNEATKD